MIKLRLTKSQATRDGALSSASRFALVGPAWLSLIVSRHSMIIGLSIAVGILVAGLLFSSFFSDFGDFFDGACGFLLDVFSRSHKPSISALRDNDDGDWIPSGVRFILLLALSGICGYLTYRGLHKLFG